MLFANFGERAFALCLSVVLVSGCGDDDAGPGPGQGGDTSAGGRHASGGAHSSGGHAGTAAVGGQAGESSDSGGTRDSEGGETASVGGATPQGGASESLGGTTSQGGASELLGGTTSQGGTSESLGGTTSQGGMVTSLGGSTGNVGGEADAGGAVSIEGGAAGAFSLGGDVGFGGSESGGSTATAGQGSGGLVATDPFIEPRWLGACTPIELSDDGKTVLANEGIWTEQTGFEAIPGLTSASLTTPLAMSRDGKVVFGTSPSQLGNELVRWTRETGTIGLGWPYADLSKPATNADGSQLVWWDRQSETATPEPYQWFPSTGVSTLHPLEFSSSCSFPWADRFSALSSSDGWTLLFSATGPNYQADFCSAAFGDDDAGLYGYTVAHNDFRRIFDALSGDGTTAAQRSPPETFAYVGSTGGGSGGDSPCLFPFSDWYGHKNCFSAQTKISELDYTGTHGLGTEVDPNGQTLATFVDHLRAFRLRDRLPGYCVAPAGVAGQISADGSIVLSVGEGRSDQGCFLASTTTSAPPLPSLAVDDFSGFGCGNCDGDALVVGTNHQCAIRPDQTVACWGKGTAGELGDGALVDSLTPRAVTGLSGVEQLAATANHTCARTSDGGVYCWGQNDHGQLGDGTYTHRAVPTQVLLPLKASYVAAGTQHSCAVLEDLSVRCWGRNQGGQLGDGTAIDSLIPVAVAGVSGATQVAAGATRSCALNQSGGVLCWGNGSFVPAAPYEAGPVTTQISMNGAGYCFLNGTSGSQNLACWGAYSNAGLNGLNEWFNGGVLTVTALHAGTTSWCFQTANGLQDCLGAIERFQGGDPGMVQPPEVVTIVPGGNGTCRLLPSGVVQCRGSLWGSNVPRCAFDAAPVTSGYSPVVP